MSYKRKIISKVDCPRCNAVAELRPENREGNIFVVYLVCPKCRYKKSVGLSSWDAYRNTVLIEKLRFWMEKTDDTILKAVLKAKIEKLEEINQKKELGL